MLPVTNPILSILLILSKTSAPLPLCLLCVENQPRLLATTPCFHLTREPDCTIISP